MQAPIQVYRWQMPWTSQDEIDTFHLKEIVKLLQETPNSRVCYIYGSRRAYFKSQLLRMLLKQFTEDEVDIFSLFPENVPTYARLENGSTIEVYPGHMDHSLRGIQADLMVLNFLDGNGDFFKSVVAPMMPYIKHGIRWNWNQDPLPPYLAGQRAADIAIHSFV